LATLFDSLCRDEVDLVVASANGTFVDTAERAAILRSCGNATVCALKTALGESVGASSLWQTIFAAQSLLTQSIPSSIVSSVGNQSPSGPFRRAVVSVCGLNQQVAGLTLIKT